ELVEDGGEQRRAVAGARERAAQRRPGLAGDIVERAERPRRRQRLARAPEDAAAAERAREALEERRLADPRLAADEDGAAFAARCRVGGGVQRREQAVALEKLARCLHWRGAPAAALSVVAAGACASSRTRPRGPRSRGRRRASATAPARRRRRGCRRWARSPRGRSRAARRRRCCRR